jgi:cation/acetate symporter
MMGIFAKKMSGPAAVWGMCSGIGVTMLYVFQHKGFMFIPGTSFLGDMGPNWFFGISPNAFGAVGAAVNFAVAFAVLRVTGPAPAHIQQMVENFRTPHGGVTAAHDH